MAVAKLTVVSSRNLGARGNSNSSNSRCAEKHNFGDFWAAGDPAYVTQILAAYSKSPAG